MRLKLLLLILALTLIIIPISNARTVDCQTTSDISLVKQCQKSENCYVGSSEQGYLVCYITMPDETQPIVEEPSNLPPEYQAREDTLSPNTIVTAETKDDKTIISIAKDGETANIEFKLVERNIGGEIVEVPKIDLNFDTKKLSNIPPLLDVNIIPYAYYSILLLFLIALGLGLFTTKEYLSPRFDFSSNKKGQIFLIAAVIFVIALYSIIIPYNTIRTYSSLQDFKEIKDNYQNEFPKVINWARYNGIDPSSYLDQFTKDFLDEAKKQDPNFGLFYIFKDSEGNVHIVNSLNNKILNIEYSDPETGEKTSIKLSNSQQNVEGEICMNDLDCVDAETDLSNVDSGYYKFDIDNPPETIKVILKNEDGSEQGIEVPVSDLIGLTYSSSYDNLENGESIVETSLEEY